MMASANAEGALVHGSCLCGGIRIRITGAPGAIVCCHCRQCRKTAGSAFQAVLPVARDACDIDDPERLLRYWRATPGKQRWFCGRCGSPVYSQRQGADTLRLRVGLLDDAPSLRCDGHIHVADAARWWSFEDDLPRYPGLEPGRSGTRSGT